MDLSASGGLHFQLHQKVERLPAEFCGRRDGVSPAPVELAHSDLPHFHGTGGVYGSFSRSIPCFSFAPPAVEHSRTPREFPTRRSLSNLSQKPVALASLAPSQPLDAGETDSIQDDKTSHAMTRQVPLCFVHNNPNTAPRVVERLNRNTAP